MKVYKQWQWDICSDVVITDAAILLSQCQTVMTYMHCSSAFIHLLMIWHCQIVFYSPLSFGWYVSGSIDVFCIMSHLKKVTWMPSFVRSRPNASAQFIRSFLRCGRPSDSFSSLWTAFTLTVHINALCNESVHGKEEHATWIDTTQLKI